LFEHFREPVGLSFNFLLLLWDLIAGEVSNFIYIFNHAAKFRFGVFGAVNEFLPVKGEPSFELIHLIGCFKKSLLNFGWIIHYNLANVWFFGETRRFWQLFLGNSFEFSKWHLHLPLELQSLSSWNFDPWRNNCFFRFLSFSINFRIW